MLWHRPPIYRLIYGEEPSSRAITLKEIIDSWIAPFLSASISPRASNFYPKSERSLLSLLHWTTLQGTKFENMENFAAMNSSRPSSISRPQDAAQNPHTPTLENLRSSDRNNNNSYMGSARQPSDAGSTDESELDFVKSVRKAHVKLLSSYGIILTLLASITFIAVLQPPGSFDPDGIVRSSKLVAAFMFFATSSFLLACTGLLTVAVGSAMMLHPRLFLQFEEIKVPSHTHHQHALGASLHPSQPNHSQDHQPPTPDATYDELTLMVNIVLDNLYRTRRLHLYMGFSLLSCVTAFLCAGFAITKASSIGFYSLVAAICLGGLPFLFEIVRMFMGPGGLPFVLEIVEEFMGPTYFRIKFWFLHKVVVTDLPIGQPTLKPTVSTKLVRIGQRFKVLCAH